MAQSETQPHSQAQSERIVALEATYAHVGTKADIADVRTEIADVRTDIANLRTELKTDIANLRTELKTDIANLRTKVSSEIGSLHTEVSSDIESLRSDLKNMRWMIGAIIAGASVLVACANLLVTLALRT